MLGYVLEKAFHDQIYVELHSFPSPNGKSITKLVISLASDRDKVKANIINSAEYLI